MMSLAFSTAKRWHSSIVRSFHRYFSSSVSWITRGMSKTSWSHLRGKNEFHLWTELCMAHRVFTWQIHHSYPHNKYIYRAKNPLGKDEWDEMTDMHGLRWWTSASVEIEGLLLLVCIQDLVHVSVSGKWSIWNELEYFPQFAFINTMNIWLVSIQLWNINKNLENIVLI